MIEFDRVTVTYPDAEAPTIRDVSLVIPEGELCLVTGHTGVGKSTLLGTINGLVPHFTGGHLQGTVRVDGRDTAAHPPRELADVVGVVAQDPLAGFVTDTVEEELAYGMEQMAIAPEVMRKRVEETLDLLGIADLRSRLLRTLSGGQQQRVAVGSVLTAHPRVLVLDEPTSALDPTAAEDVLAAVTRLVHDLGVTVMIAEHRLERVAQYADRAIHVHRDGTVVMGTPAEILEWSPVAPPVVRLGRVAGWSPVPLSVRDARRLAGPLRARLAALPGPTAVPDPTGSVPRTRADLHAFAGQNERGEGPIVVDARGVTVRYGKVVAVREVDLRLAEACREANDAPGRVRAYCDAIATAPNDARAWTALARLYRVETESGAAAYAQADLIIDTNFVLSRRIWKWCWKNKKILLFYRQLALQEDGYKKYF